MRRLSLGAVVALVSALAAPAPPAAADPVVAVISIEARIGCHGCGTYGPAGNQLTGTVLTGTSPFATGETITGTFTVNEGTGTGCVVSGTANGTLTTSGGHTAAFSWTRTLGSATWTIAGSPAGASTFAVVNPTGGLPCGAAATAHMLLVIGGDMAGAAARGHVTLHRFPASSRVMPGIRFLFAPVAQNGTPWTCRDVNTGATVVAGDLLATPHPGVACVPPGNYSVRCDRVDAGGYAAEGSGSITVTSACTGLATGTVMQVPTAVNYAPSVTGSGRAPWSCRVHESLPAPADTDYWVFCQVNMP